MSFTFSMSITAATGITKRVAFYALKLPPDSFPEIGERLAPFFKEAPSYDAEEMNAVAWSFGEGAKRYIKAERSYCGQLVELSRDLSSALTSEDAPPVFSGYGRDGSTMAWLSQWLKSVHLPLFGFFSSEE
jgi:hypothetical protein